MCAVDHYRRSEGRDADGLPAWVFEIVTGQEGRIMRTGFEPFMNLSGVGVGRKVFWVRRPSQERQGD